LTCPQKLLTGHACLTVIVLNLGKASGETAQDPLSPRWASFSVNKIFCSGCFVVTASSMCYPATQKNQRDMLVLLRLEEFETQVSADKKPQKRPMFGTGVKHAELFGSSCSA
ncbi:hypothetical protein STEG23_030327, partial [Scotinomys teguina]